MAARPQQRRPISVAGVDPLQDGAAVKVAILAGGLGSRLSEETESKPKPMVEIGGRPILGTFPSTTRTTASMIFSSPSDTRAST